MERLVFALGPATRTCIGPKGDTCTAENSAPPWVLLLLFLGAAGLVYLAVTVSDIVKKEPTSRGQALRQPSPRQRPRTRSAPKSTADRLERAAEVTGAWQRPFSWMDIRTITGKLTLGAWLSRWWASGSYMRRRLIVSITAAAAITTLLVVGVLLLD